MNDPRHGNPPPTAPGGGPLGPAYPRPPAGRPAPPVGHASAPPQVWQRPERRVRSPGAALAALACFSVLAPVVVMLVGVVVLAVIWALFAMMLALTGGSVAADESTGELYEGAGGQWFSNQLAELLPWAGGSFVLSLVVGGLTVLLLRGTTGVRYWHPTVQGALGGLVGVALALVVGLFAVV
ncbi:hypothetical protein [Nocardioides daphniae]|uniref:Uncharacterized protein n=1 Tax=Nocardioides daphniae TaxID=402297 RepID=A0A4P7UC14_9ACTN|nr:hypothetical protein [Nocardioides daphniae]QCC76865.1 hypothetical protein E2C04_05870 [Nocardioides daphniae]GGD17226.1 hypothetical protein GCM10007231_15230 [Nocardioides daphniae]